MVLDLKQEIVCERKKDKFVSPHSWKHRLGVGYEDPWWRFSGAVQMFNKNRKDLIVPPESLAIDQSMNAFRPQMTETGGMPNIAHIICKPEDLGKEFKTICCPVTGVMIYMELQQGKELMKKSEHFSEIGAMASCVLRAAEYLTRKKGRSSKELIVGDSWFGSVKAAVAAKKSRIGKHFPSQTKSCVIPRKSNSRCASSCTRGDKDCAVRTTLIWSQTNSHWI